MANSIILGEGKTLLGYVIFVVTPPSPGRPDNPSHAVSLMVDPRFSALCQPRLGRENFVKRFRSEPPFPQKVHSCATIANLMVNGTLYFSGTLLDVRHAYPFRTFPPKSAEPSPFLDISTATLRPSYRLF